MQSDAIWMCEYWNERFPEGTPVIVHRDNGNKLETVTRSEAWVLGGHTAVISVKGISGCYSLGRVAPQFAAWLVILNVLIVLAVIALVVYAVYSFWTPVIADIYRAKGY